MQPCHDPVDIIRCQPGRWVNLHTTGLRKRKPVRHIIDGDPFARRLVVAVQPSQALHFPTALRVAKLVPQNFRCRTNKAIGEMFATTRCDETYQFLNAVFTPPGRGENDFHGWHCRQDSPKVCAATKKLGFSLDGFRVQHTVEVEDENQSSITKSGRKPVSARKRSLGYPS